MKIKEINVSLSGVIPVAAYENLRPGFSITVEPENGEDKDKIITELRHYLHGVFENEANRGKADLIEKQYSKIRFYEKDGKKYPSVTSILGWDKDWKITDDELQQYASRGNILEALVTQFMFTGKWIDPMACEALREDVAIVFGGSKGFRLEDCSHKAFMEKYGDKSKPEKVQGTVYNDEMLYAGTYDILGAFEGKRSIMDIKSGGFDMRQLAAYAVCCEGVEQLVVLPVGPTDNKCGYKQPVICTTIQNEYKEFLKARAKFRCRFGI